MERNIEIGLKRSRLLGIPEVALILGLPEKTVRIQVAPGSGREFPIEHRKLGKLVKFDSKDVLRISISEANDMR